ncbi:MAG: hypothetical protein ABSC11_06690 [Smithella sp.]|jgi:hypothetical protein
MIFSAVYPPRIPFLLSALCVSKVEDRGQPVSCPANILAVAPEFSETEDNVRFEDFS